jgi:hypothetical protein
MSSLLWRRGVVAVFVTSLLLATIAPSWASDTQYIYGTGADGVTRELAVDRVPALYTGDFGDCLGGQSLFNITKFDAAYFADNMTVLFHIDGSSNIRNESLMMIITMEAYGETRYTKTFDPCFVNMASLCPLNASVPITGYAAFPLGPLQVNDIPSIALDIPDFDGFVRMQIFANSSQTQIGCFQAVMTNGNSFGHPEIIAPVLGLFTAIAVLASIATAVYGVSVQHVRTHYAHSFSVLLIFETFQTCFFSGALTVPWPSALVAWWSNFAWSAGMISIPAMTRSISPFAGINGNSSQVGGAGSTVIVNQGGATQIYGRGIDTAASLADAAAELVRRKAYDENNPFDYTWGGDPVTPGMPLPGTYVGFSGQLSKVGIPAADAFLVGFIWLLVAVGLLVLGFMVLKGIVEYLVRYKWVRDDAFAHFRSHSLKYTGVAVLRLLYAAFFMIMTLAIYQFAIQGSAGATAIAGLVFVAFAIGMGGMVAYACRARLRYGRYSLEPDTIVLERTKLFKSVPVIWPTRSSTLKERELAAKPAGSLPFLRIAYLEDDPTRPHVHQDAAFVKKFGWLSARYRRTRWWFFAYYLVYHFFRACFLGGGVANPLAQVYGLFLYEIIAFLVVIKLRPFEGRRNTVLGVWMLGICKVFTSGLSIGLLPAFKLNRIIATVIGVIIIVLQAFVVIAVLILAILGAVSSWMSLARNREDFEPEFMDKMRMKYFARLEAAAPDDPLAKREKEKQAKEKKMKKTPERRRSVLQKGKERALTPKPKPEPEHEPQVPKEPYFSVNTVRRAPKIEDEDGDVIADMDAPHNNSTIFDPTRVMNRPNRASSISSRYSVGSLPRAARAHRTSWSSKDFAQWDASMTDLELQRPTSVNALSPRRSTSLAGFHSAHNSLNRPIPSRASLGSLRSDEQPVSPISPDSPVPPSPTRATMRKHASERIGSPAPMSPLSPVISRNPDEE